MASEIFKKNKAIVDDLKNMETLISQFLEEYDRIQKSSSVPAILVGKNIELTNLSIAELRKFPGFINGTANKLKQDIEELNKEIQKLHISK